MHLKGRTQLHCTIHDSSVSTSVATSPPSLAPPVRVFLLVERGAYRLQIWRRLKTPLPTPQSQHLAIRAQRSIGARLRKPRGSAVSAESRARPRPLRARRSVLLFAKKAASLQTPRAPPPRPATSHPEETPRRRQRTPGQICLTPPCAAPRPADDSRLARWWSHMHYVAIDGTAYYMVYSLECLHK